MCIIISVVGEIETCHSKIWGASLRLHFPVQKHKCAL